jgi:hypothetical protein
MMADSIAMNAFVESMDPDGVASLHLFGLSASPLVELHWLELSNRQLQQTNAERGRISLRA